MFLIWNLGLEPLVLQNNMLVGKCIHLYCIISWYDMNGQKFKEMENCASSKPQCIGYTGGIKWTYRNVSNYTNIICSLAST